MAGAKSVPARRYSGKSTLKPRRAIRTRRVRNDYAAVTRPSALYRRAVRQELARVARLRADTASRRAQCGRRRVIRQPPLLKQDAAPVRRPRLLGASDPRLCGLRSRSWHSATRRMSPLQASTAALSWPRSGQPKKPEYRTGPTKGTEGGSTLVASIWGGVPLVLNYVK